MPYLTSLLMNGHWYVIRYPNLNKLCRHAATIVKPSKWPVLTSFKFGFALPHGQAISPEIENKAPRSQIPVRASLQPLLSAGV